MNPPNWHFSLMAPVYDAIGGMINRLDPVPLLAPEAGDQILDLGGGTGLLRPAFDGVPLSSWTVLDLNEWMLRRGKEKGRDCHFVNGSAYQLPFRSNRFDRALITDALHHMGQKKRVLSEANRVLRKGGTLLIEEFDPDTPIGKLTETAEWLGGMGSEFVRSDRLCDMVRAAGLDVRRTRRHQYLYYVVASEGG
jgi:demethylmenaquinone methyltransferase/2-methoxy-6-polyprenyl-1,4-benzoquinol methylase